MNELTQELMDEALSKGVVKSRITKVLYTVPILRDGDSIGWVVKTELGNVVALTTSHGWICRWHGRRIKHYLKQLKDAAAEAEAALQLMELQ